MPHDETMIETIALAYAEAYRSVTGRRPRPVSEQVKRTHGPKVLAAIMESTAERPYDYFRALIMASRNRTFRTPFHFCHGDNAAKTYARFVEQHGDMTEAKAELVSIFWRLREAAQQEARPAIELVGRREFHAVQGVARMTRVFPLFWRRVRELDLRRPTRRLFASVARVPADELDEVRRFVEPLVLDKTRVETLTGPTWAALRDLMDRNPPELRESHVGGGANVRRFEKRAIIEPIPGRARWRWTEEADRLRSAMIEHEGPEWLGG